MVGSYRRLESTPFGTRGCAHAAHRRSRCTRRRAGVGHEDGRRAERARTNASSSVNGNVSLAPDARTRGRIPPDEPADGIRHVAVRKKCVGACAPQALVLDASRGRCASDSRAICFGVTPRDTGSWNSSTPGRPRRSTPAPRRRPLDLLQAPRERERLPLRTAEAGPLEHDRDADPARRGCARRRPERQVGRRGSVHAAVVEPRPQAMVLLASARVAPRRPCSREDLPYGATVGRTSAERSGRVEAGTPRKSVTYLAAPRHDAHEILVDDLVNGHRQAAQRPTETLDLVVALSEAGRESSLAAARRRRCATASPS